MAAQHLELIIRGKQRTWSIEFYGDPKYLATWRADGLEINVIVNTMPDWMPARLRRLWFVAQDIFNFRNPLK